MANANVSRVGQQNLAGATDALWLKVFAGEVLTYFNNATVFMDKVQVRTITAGKSATFAALGLTSASYHTPGTEITGNAVRHDERVISLDDILISPIYIAEVDELKNHYDVRSDYRTQIVQALAQTHDKQVAQVGLLAARAAGVADQPGGTVQTNASYSSNSDTLAAGIFSAAQAFDEKNTPNQDRWMFLKPAQYYLCAQNTKLINRDWGGAFDANGGAYKSGTFESLAGLTIVKTNNLPSTNVNTGPSAYQGDFSTTVGLAMQRGAVGTIKRADLTVSLDWDFRRLAHLLNARYLMGHGILRPQSAIEFKTS